MKRLCLDTPCTDLSSLKDIKRLQSTIERMQVRNETLQRNVSTLQSALAEMPTVTAPITPAAVPKPVADSSELARPASRLDSASKPIRTASKAAFRPTPSTKEPPATVKPSDAPLALQRNSATASRKRSRDVDVAEDAPTPARAITISPVAAKPLVRPRALMSRMASPVDQRKPVTKTDGLKPTDLAQQRRAPLASTGNTPSTQPRNDASKLMASLAALRQPAKA